MLVETNAVLADFFWQHLLAYKMLAVVTAKLPSSSCGTNTYMN